MNELIEEPVAHYPGACAVVDERGHHSYEEIHLRSGRLARDLEERGVQPGDRVCLLVPKSADAIVSILAVLGAGAVYVPLDTESPPRRVSWLLADCSPCWLLAPPEQRALVGRCLEGILPELRPRVLWLDAAPEPGSGGAMVSSRTGPPAAPRTSGGPGDDSLAYILFTSGSTGRPKGVPITHQSALHFVSWANTHFGLGPDDRVSGHAPLSFDVSVWDVFGALGSGATLHLVPARANLLPSLTASFIRERRLTQWASVPSILLSMAHRDVVRHGDFPDLRRLIWYGEVAPTPTIRHWMERLPHVGFTNVYGPTEVTIACSHHTLDAPPEVGGAPVPIGVPVPGKRLAVLDSDRRPSGVDQIGELYVGGVGLTPGYWGDPGRTARAFCELPPGSGERWYRTGDLARIDADGVFHFHGRTDRQIKSRGYRIELDEVARALDELPGLEESAVVAVPSNGFEGMRICAAYVAPRSAPRTPASLRAELATLIPSYMLPARWLALDALPRNQSGKVDHPALQEIFLDEA